MQNKDKAWDSDSIQKKIDTTSKYLKEHKYLVNNILAEELIAYFEGEAPSGDTTTLEQILESKWLLLHEIVEICELKKSGYTIAFDLLLSSPAEVYKAHLIATDWEFRLAKKEGAEEWIRKRLLDVQFWLEDPNLPPSLLSKCKELIQKYS